MTGQPHPGPEFGPALPEDAWAPPSPQQRLPEAAWPPPTMTPEREHPWFWRAPWIAWWRPVLALVLGCLGFILVTTLVTLVAVAVESANTGTPVAEILADVATGRLSNYTFLANSVGLGLLVPVGLALQRVVRQRPGFLSSVTGRLRWGFLLTSFLITLVAVGGVFLVSVLTSGTASLGLAVREDSWWLLAAIIAVTPFQAAGEEYLIRGILWRAVAGLVPSRAWALGLGAGVSSVVFMFLHGAGDPWLNLTYFAMGLLFCHLTWRTGGLEAAVGMHAANNLVGLGLVPFTDLDQVFERSAGAGGPAVLLQLVLLAVAAAVIEGVARRRQLVRQAVPVRA